MKTIYKTYTNQTIATLQYHPHHKIVSLRNSEGQLKQQWLNTTLNKIEKWFETEMTEPMTKTHKESWIKKWNFYTQKTRSH